MKIVVDTNIVFSTILNSSSRIADLLFNSDKHFQFYSCNYLRYELNNNWEKLKRISKLTDEQLNLSYTLVLSKIAFINEESIPSNIWLDSEIITKDIDIDDTDFVALTTYLDATLWTGDLVLLNGLKKNGYKIL